MTQSISLLPCRAAMAILDDCRKDVKREKDRVRRMRRTKKGTGESVGKRVDRRSGVRTVRKSRA